jgi:hypothetical protein
MGETRIPRFVPSAIAAAVVFRLELLRQDFDDVIATWAGSQTLTALGLP